MFDGLYLPPKPAIILPRPKELIRPELVLGGTLMLNPLVGFVGKPVSTSYRYMLLEVTAIATNGFDVAVVDANWWDPVASSWKPTSNMTSNSAPSPLVAAATENSAGDDAWEAYDGNLASGSHWKSTQTPSPTFSPAVWLMLDHGAGNEFNPTKFQLAPQDVNRAPRSFNLYGSNDANAMSSPTTSTNTLLYAATGLTSGWTALTMREFTF